MDLADLKLRDCRHKHLLWDKSFLLMITLFYGAWRELENLEDYYIITILKNYRSNEIHF